MGPGGAHDFEGALIFAVPRFAGEASQGLTRDVQEGALIRGGQSVPALLIHDEKERRVEEAAGDQCRVREKLGQVEKRHRLRGKKESVRDAVRERLIGFGRRCGDGNRSQNLGDITREAPPTRILSPRDPPSCGRDPPG